MLEFLIYTTITLFLILFVLWLLLELLIRIGEQLPKWGATLIELWVAWYTAQAEIVEARERRWKE